MISAVPSSVLAQVTMLLTEKLEDTVAPLHFTFSGGGCINHGGKLTTTAGAYFLKWNQSGSLPEMFRAEAKGLKLLATTGSVTVPEVIAVGEDDAYQFILMLYVEEGARQNRYWEELGHALARLHRCSHDLFGLDHDNYIGSLPQSNTRNKSWIDFFVEQRLGNQLRLGFPRGWADTQVQKRFDLLYQRLPELIPEERPALIHGDLWGGNLMTGETGHPVLIDPAVYYGHREMDMAFTTLFGGFDKRFYEAYQADYPMEGPWRDRCDIHNLYPLLVHANLFGGGYVGQIQAILKRYT